MREEEKSRRRRSEGNEEKVEKRDEQMRKIWRDIKEG